MIVYRYRGGVFYNEGIMNKRFFLPALLCGLIVAILTIGCNNVLLKKENNFSVSFVTPVIDGTSSRVSRSVTGVDWNITAWLELQDGSTLQTQETRAASGVPVSLPFEPVEVGTELKVKVELLGIANGIKYADESDWIVVKAEDNPIDLTPSLVPDTTAPLGSQTNPVTTWADLVTIVSDSTTTNAIYIAGTPDSSGLYTMEATSSITISSNTTIIPTNNVTILRGSSFTDKLFNVTGTLNLGNSGNSFVITLDGQNSAVEQPLVYSSGTLNMTNSVITKNNNSNDYVSPSSLFIFSGTTTLNNVSFSGNTSGLSGAADIYLHQGSSQAQLNLAESFAATEIYFSASMSITSYPVIQLNQNTSVKDTNKIKVTVGSTNPEGITVVNKNGYTGDLNNLFTVVATNDAGNTTYTLNDEGKVEVAPLGSKTNPITNWADLKSTMERDSAPSQIYIAGNMEATETITFASYTPSEIIAASATTIARSSSFTSDLLFETATELTFTGTEKNLITITGNNVEADSPIISAEADLTMTYCTLQNSINKSTSGGGGALNIEGSSSSSQITSCTFEGNSASEGGGIYINNQARVVLNGVTMSENTITSTNTSQPTQDIYMNNAPHITFENEVNIPVIYWNRGSNDNQVFTSGSDQNPFSDTSSIGLTISGTIPTTTLRIFIDPTALTDKQIQCFTITANDQEYTVTSYGTVEFQ